MDNVYLHKCADILSKNTEKLMVQKKQDKDKENIQNMELKLVKNITKKRIEDKIFDNLINDNKETLNG